MVQMLQQLSRSAPPCVSIVAFCVCFSNRQLTSYQWQPSKQKRPAADNAAAAGHIALYLKWSHQLISNIQHQLKDDIASKAHIFREYFQ